MRNIFVTAQSRSGHNFIANQLESWGVGDVTKIEGYPPKEFSFGLAQQINSKLVLDKPHVHIIVVRDLFNWFASYLTWISKTESKNIVVDDDHLDQRISVWREITEEAFGKTNFLDNKIACDYGAFKISQGYRMRLCLDLGGMYNEDRLNVIMPNGNGSSFDGFEYQDRANDTDTENRYKEMLNSPLWLQYWESLRRNHHKNINI